MNTSDLAIQLVHGAQADSLLASGSFLAQWSELVTHCPWATVFQTPEFAVNWYRAYSDRYEPVLVLSYGGDGRLQGLLSLAASRPASELIVAGGVQAEYQAWICAPELGSTFPLWAARRLRQAFPASELHFCYLPPETPTGWVRQCDMSGQCLLHTHRRPLLRFGDGEGIEESLRRDTNKNRLRHLQKMGPLAFRRITDVAELEALLDLAVPWHDARHLAVHGVTPFADDPRIKRFILAVMGVKGMAHATAMTVGEQLVTLYLGLCGKREVVLCSFAYNPWLAKCSPGKFHTYFLARMLMQEGYERLDLTPGGDAYKERFANAWDEVHTLDLFPSSARRQIAAMRVNLKETARTLLNAVHIAPRRAKSFVARVRQLCPADILSGVRIAGAWVSSRLETQVYVHNIRPGADRRPAIEFRRDCMADLLAYDPHARGPSRQAFMAAAFRRIEEGQHAYTYVEDGHLLQLGWLMERPVDAVVKRWLPLFPFPERSALAMGFYSDPHARGRGLEALALQAMLHDVARTGSIEHLVVAHSADDGVLRRAAQTVEPSYRATVIERCWFGYRMAWVVRPRALPKAADRGAVSRQNLPSRASLSVIAPW